MSWLISSEAPGADTTSILPPQENEEGEEEDMGMEKGATTLGDLTQDEVRPGIEGERGTHMR